LVLKNNSSLKPALSFFTYGTEPPLDEGGGGGAFLLGQGCDERSNERGEERSDEWKGASEAGVGRVVSYVGYRYNALMSLRSNPHLHEDGYVENVQNLPNFTTVRGTFVLVQDQRFADSSGLRGWKDGR